jgi:CheY-like chemotaxis protein
VPESTSLVPARPTLMVVDDDPSVLLLVDVIAEQLGFRVKAIASALQALEELRDGCRPDVIMVDIMMPKIDGAAFLRHLGDIPSLAGTAVIAMSTRAVLERYVPGLGVAGSLTKPFDRRTLEGCLRRFTSVRPAP